MLVLVAHPVEDVRVDLATRLRALGHVVEEAADGDAALETCRRLHPPVALAHDELRTSAGTPLLEAVKRDVDAFRTAVVLLDPGANGEAALLALRRGAQDLLAAEPGTGELATRVVSAERTKILQEELARQSERLEGLIFGDELTGLPNRRFLLTQLQALVSGAHRHGRELSVVMLDIDHFKRVNDTHGHAAGDSVLAAIATTLRDRLREEDWVGRLSGEEFLALLPDVGGDGAHAAADALRHAIAHMGVRVEGRVLRCTISAGWASLEASEDADALLKRADVALYEAKAAGRDRVHGAASLRPRL